MKKIILLAWIPIVSLTWSSCSKDDGVEDTIPPTVTLFEPSQSTYNLGDTVWMDIEVKDDIELHEVKWWLIQEPADTVYWNKRHTHNIEVRIRNTYYVIPEEESAKGAYQFVVLAEDDARNDTVERHDFTVE